MKKVLLSLVVLGLIFTSCKKEDDNNDITPTANNELSGDISTEKNLDASIEYKLTGSLRITEGGVLNIPAGTIIKAAKGFNKYILVEMGGKININGTKEKPVKITSAATSPAMGDWGGLIINGKAKISGDASVAIAKGTTEIDPSAAYGGDNDADNSGSITYLILEYTGAKSSASVEHNGLTLNAVGNGTIIENIYVIDGADDGVEFFGGAVNVTNLLVVNSEDDMFDLTQGWRGTLKNAYGIWESGYESKESDPRGIEADGNFDGLTPSDINQSKCKFENITIVNESSFEMHDAIKIRRGATLEIKNILIKGGKCKDIIDVLDSKGNGNTASSVEYKIDGVTVAGKELNNISGTDTVKVITKVIETNTGANTSVFGWTGHNF